MKLKTEHNGAKHGNGAFYGTKREAKKMSNKVRRASDRRAVRGALTDVEELTPYQSPGDTCRRLFDPQGATWPMILLGSY